MKQFALFPGHARSLVWKQMPPIRKPGWAKWLIPVTSALGKERHKNSREFQASMRYSETLSHKNNEEEEVEEDTGEKRRSGGRGGGDRGEAGGNLES